MLWPFGKRPRPEPEPEAPLRDGRLGPDPPPPPSATPPGVTVSAFRAAPAALAERSASRPARSLLVRLQAGTSMPVGSGSDETAVLVLLGSLRAASPSGAFSLAAGDVVVASAAHGLSLSNSGPEPAAVLLDQTPGGSHPGSGPHRVGRDELVGAGFAGVTGIRAVYRTGSSCGLRMGPPPGARWALVGLRGLAVFAGKLLIVDGNLIKEVLSGQLATVADPRVPLYVQAGNDAAVAVGFAAPGVLVRLG